MCRTTMYDPLGSLASVTIRFKVLIQKLCQDNLEWIVDLPEDLIKEWNNLVNDLGEGGSLSIPRSFVHHVSGSSTSTTLRGFRNASLHVYTTLV